ncbi:hypothetical protein [Methylosinus sp. PW1]|uniref:hypothetical protein n=1 Tax=Methylosinus sp. PW1 TaxID=107636 RepID=UPI0006904188|nr:hypothetical protein [Methylosinus sp. PW1]
MLAERYACPEHHGLLSNHGHTCNGPRHVGFRLRDGCARLVCGHCEQEFAERSAREEEGALVDAPPSFQGRISAIVNGAPEGRSRHDPALATLWAPLDVLGTARPVLSLRSDSGWRCPSDARNVIGSPDPLGRAGNDADRPEIRGRAFMSDKPTLSDIEKEPTGAALTTRTRVTKRRHRLRLRHAPIRLRTAHRGRCDRRRRGKIPAEIDAPSLFCCVDEPI